MYQNTQLFIDNAWCASASGASIPVENPSTGDIIGSVAHAGIADLDRAIAAAGAGFEAWRKVSPFDRSKIMRAAAELVRQRADRIAELMTWEQGKPLAEAKSEIMAGADIIDWFAEEARRTYGRIIPSRLPGARQMVVKEPVGPVAAFSPWNFPINQAVRKLSASLAAGCSIILKAPEETPAAPAELVKAFADAGVPAGAIGLVYGVPGEISEYLIPHPVIRKISFTGSTAVGKKLAALAGQHMKRATMELGGHGPAIVCDDADVEAAVLILSMQKFRNGGQVCVAPTRFIVQRRVYDHFVELFVRAAKKIRVGDGFDESTQMGPLANIRRIGAMESFISDAVGRGAKIETGGKRIGDKGNFFEPTVLSHIPLKARVMNEEPFGPLALMIPFDDVEEALSEANRLEYGLAAYAYTRSLKTATMIASAMESGMISVNHHGLALPEVPFGGIKDSGYGSEGGIEAMEAYLNTKFVTQVGV